MSPDNTPDSSANALKRNLQQMTTILAKAGINVYLVEQVPEADNCFAAKQFLLHKQFPSFQRLSPSAVTLEDHISRQKRVNSAFESISTPSFHRLDPTPYFFQDSRFLNLYSTRSVYRDDDHLTKFGVQTHLAEMMDGLFVEISRKAVSTN